MAEGRRNIVRPRLLFHEQSKYRLLVFVVLAFFVAYPRLTTIGSHADEPRKADRNPRGADQRKICINSQNSLSLLV